MMDFAFDEEQDELRQTVRQALARQFPVATLRQFFEAAPDRQATEAQTRWSMLSALGAPGLLVPESAGGLGLSDVDLVGVLEEAGWAALPEPLLETAALAAPMLATLLPAPSAAAALAALLTEDAPLAVGGIDVGVAGPS
jgi:alkylation response protein AidB-like acyl-CoA dehydrogenase